jgi:hypothetical protein
MVPDEFGIKAVLLRRRGEVHIGVIDVEQHADQQE